MIVLRKPAPEGPAPRPSAMKTQTLNRLEFSKRREHQKQSKTNHIQFQDTSKQDAIYWKPNDIGSKQQAPSSIYAPASCTDGPTSYLASQHYASSACKRPPSVQSSHSISSLFGSLKRRSKRGWSSLMRPRSGSLFRKQAADSYSDTYSLGATGNETTTTTTKRILDAESIYAEGYRAIDQNQISRSLPGDLGSLEAGQKRLIIMNPNQADFRLLIELLRNWCNDLLTNERIIVTNLEEDLYDGQIFIKLFERLQGVKLDLIEVTQNEELQKRRLFVLLGHINRILRQQARWAQIRWSVEGIHGKNLPEILHLLIFLAIHYRAPIRLPANVKVQVLEFYKLLPQPPDEVYSASTAVSNNLHLIKQRSHEIQLTSTYETSLDEFTQSPSSSAIQLNDGILKSERDSFDELLDRGPAEKILAVEKSLVRFVNRHLAKLNMTCLSSTPKSVHHHHLSRTQNDKSYKTGKSHILDPLQFSDGILLVFLIASLEDYFVPLGSLFASKSNIQSYRTSNSLTHDMTTVAEHSKTNDPIYNVPLNGLGPSAIEPENYINTHPIGRLHNVNVALELIQETGLEHVRQIAKAEHIVNGDLKTILRLLYLLFSRYKQL